MIIICFLWPCWFYFKDQKSIVWDYYLSRIWTICYFILFYFCLHFDTGKLISFLFTLSYETRFHKPKILPSHLTDYGSCIQHQVIFTKFLLPSCWSEAISACKMIATFCMHVCVGRGGGGWSQTWPH